MYHVQVAHGKKCNDAYDDNHHHHYDHSYADDDADDDNVDCNLYSSKGALHY